MADLEVENTLREIRERVMAEAQRRAPAGGADSAPAAHARNGAGAEAGAAGEALARLDANLATTARAWSRLPPVLSYRSGTAARVELWLKRLFKRAAQWFTWEQVNFNAAVHHALGDTRAALAAQEQALAAQEQALAAQGQALASLRSELLASARAEADANRARLSELQTRLAHAEARSAAEAAQLRREFAAGLERLAEAQRASEVGLREGLLGAQSAQIDARAEELHAEVRVRLDALLEEQRVCFKQLSLEAGEAAVAQDRARRHIEARLDALEGGEKSGD